MTKVACIGVATAVAVALAGCSSSVPGSVVMTTVPAPAGQVDLTQLNPGNYPTTPRPPLGTAGDAQRGKTLESLRMANYLVGPWEVDPELLEGAMADTVDTKLLDHLFGVGIGAVAAAHHLTAGFAAQRFSRTQQKSLVHVVLRFPNPQDAAAATAQMAKTGSNTPPAPGEAPAQYQRVPIPRHPETSGMSHLWDDNGHWSTMAFTSHGPYVLGQFVSSQDSTDAAVDLIATMLDRQGPLIDQFQPTPTDQLANLPIDPDGLLARTLPPGEGDGTVTDPPAQLLRDNDPPRSKRLFDRAHLQRVGHGATTVYQTPDIGSAQQIVDGFTAEATDIGFDGHQLVPAAGIQGMPGARCFTPKESGASPHYCLATADHYAIEVTAAQERDAHQLISAQYLMLTQK